MSRHLSRPKTPAARYAWDAFERLFGCPPTEISYGHGIDYGWIWTAEHDGAIAIYSASWANATWGRIKKNTSASHCH
jgi:hypothetical protein